MSLLAGVLTVSVAEAPAGAATTTTVSLHMTAGTFAVKHNTPGPVPVITTPVFTGKETPKAGSFATAAFTFPTQHNQTGGPTTSTGPTAHPTSAETILVYPAPTTHVVASMTTTGKLSIGATLQYEVHITKPVNLDCKALTTVHVELTSTAPYAAKTKTITVTSSTITVPSFGGCAAGQLSPTFSGPGGELSLTMHGTLTVPTPSTPSKTVLTATPAGPQLQGSAVTLKATVQKATGAAAATAAGPVTFKNGTTVLGSATALAGKATLTTKTLPVGTDSITASFAGGGGYRASTSSPVTYAIKAKPTVAVSNLPKAIPGGNAAYVPFTVTVTNPSNGLTITHLFLTLTLLGGWQRPIESVLVLQYENSASSWCTLIAPSTRQPIYIDPTVSTGSFVGDGSSCNTFPASFASAAGSVTTIHMRAQFPATPTYPNTALYGSATFKASLFTGACTSTSKCTAAAPMTGSSAPSGSATTGVYPSSPFATVSKSTSYRPQVKFVQNFLMTLKTTVQPTPALATTGGYFLTTKSKNGSVTYAVDGTTIATSTGLTPTNPAKGEWPFLYNIGDLSVGKHQLTATFNPDTFTGHMVFKPSSYVFTFTVVGAPKGTLYDCAVTGFNHGKYAAYLTVTGTVPKAALPTTTVKATNASVTMVVDPINIGGYAYRTNTSSTLQFSPTGTQTVVGKVTFVPSTGTANTATAFTAKWSGLSPKMTIKQGTPLGSSVTLGLAKVTSNMGLLTGTQVCTPATTNVPAAVGSTEVAGTSLAVSPSSPVTQGTPVTLTATVYPEPATGSTPTQMQFFDGSKTLGTTLVSTNGISRGTATLTVSTLAAGAHTLRATWSGSPSAAIPVNVSNTVPFTVNATPVTKPVVTTEPANQTVTAGQTATFSAAASGTPKPTVQWQVEAAGSSTWANVTGATSSTLSFSAETSQSTNKYRAVFTNAGGTATTTAATLTVNAATPSSGYWQVAQDGGVFAFGSAHFYGSMGGQPLNAPIVGMAPTPTGKGYWLVASDGGIFAFGAAHFYGSMGGKPLNQPIVGMTATPTGKGYWEVAADGGLFAFGSAQFYGSMGNKPLNQPVVGMTATATGKGYWEVASDGGLFAFGTATFYGSMGGKPLNQPIVGMAATPTGKGYYEVASDGGLFAFGNVAFYGSTGGIPLTKPIVGMAVTPTGGGYYEVASDGGLFTFGNAGFDGSLGGTPLNEPIVAMAVA